MMSVKSKMSRRATLIQLIRLQYHWVLSRAIAEERAPIPIRQVHISGVALDSCRLSTISS